METEFKIRAKIQTRKSTLIDIAVEFRLKSDSLKLPSVLADRIEEKIAIALAIIAGAVNFQRLDAAKKILWDVYDLLQQFGP